MIYRAFVVISATSRIYISNVVVRR